MQNKNRIEELLYTAWKQRGLGEVDTVKNTLEQIRSLCGTEDHEHFGRLNHIYMQLDYDQDLYQSALEFNKISVDHYLRSGNQDRIAHALRHRGDLYFELGDLNKSKTCYMRVLEIYRENKETSSLDLANALRKYGLLLERLNKNSHALPVWKEVEDLYARCNLKEGILEAREHIDKINE